MRLLSVFLKPMERGTTGEKLAGRVAAVPLGALVAAALAVAACGGNEFVYTPADASTGSAGGDAAAGPETAVEAGGESSAFCMALRSYYDHCGFTGACDQRNLDNCGVDAFDLSEVAREAFIACQGNIACNRGGTAWVRESCVSAKLAVAVPTKAQAKLAQDYCTTCMPNATNCSATSFFREGVIAAGDGPGFDSLLYNDTIVGMIDQSCVMMGLMCVAFRSICEDGIISQQVPPDACKD